ncbi:hypothetical protein L227DRAFT_344713 [Lentinus tigrinus ALCF2SS1-6]|uniref:Uncharacterized protein n=1 Tax=Lentinus tigrinus ALCF2SS1-6 TaxID=1328759 RepID=A0A5C2RVC7_9APHY|nr:hypothetical protein L227DRAFT_344713 [Lentinus tigrinus ALCF2SS1-6]
MESSTANLQSASVRLTVHQTASWIVDDVPSELLVQIFQSVQWVTGWQSPSSQIVPAWISFTWVCRRWRDVALSSPILWTSIRNTGPKSSHGQRWLPIFLERAQGAPLDIDISLRCSKEICAETLRTIEPYSSTIRQFRICLKRVKPEMVAYRTLVSPLITKMRNVEELTLLTSFYPNDADMIYATRDHLPSLGSFCADHQYIPWSSSVYTGLRSLNITPFRSPPSPSEFFQILRGCPDMEELVFGPGLPRPGAPPAGESEESFFVALPRLRTMKLAGRPSQIEFVSRYIEVPPTCSIDIGLSGTHDHPNIEVAALIPGHRMLQPVLPTCTTFSLSVDHDSHRARVDLVMKGRENHLHMTSAQYLFHNERHGPLPLGAEACSELLKALHPSPLTEFRLIFDSVEFIEREVWIDCFSRFPLLETIAFGPHFPSVHPPSSFLSALTSSETEGTSVPLDRLRVLGLTSIRLNDAVSQNILSMLRHRASRGVPLSELVLKGCYCDPDVDIDTLKETLQKLVKLSIRYPTDPLACCGRFGDCKQFQYHDFVST